MADVPLFKSRPSTLQEMISRTRPFTPEETRDKARFKIYPGKELYNLQIQPISYMVDKLLCEESQIYLAGPAGSFKTGLMIHIALCGATGKPVLGEFPVTTPFNTLFLDEENGLRRTKHKFHRLVRGLGFDGTEDSLDKIHFSCITGFKIENSWITDLESLILKNQYKLIVIDNIARCFVGSERDEHDVARIQALIKPIIERQHVTFVILHHCRKPDERRKGQPRTLNDIRGSSDFGGQCDEAFLLETFGKTGEHTKLFTLSQLKIKDGEEMMSISIKVTGDSESNSPLIVAFDGTVKDKVNQKTEKIKVDILTWWSENMPLAAPYVHKTKTIVDAMKELNYKDTQIRKALKELCDEDKLEYSYGFYKLPI